MALFLVIAWEVPSAVEMLLGGMAVALVLSFPVRLLSRVVPRGLAILLSYLLLGGLISLAVGSIVPIVVDQLVSLARTVPGVVNRAAERVNELLVPLQERGILTQSPEQLLSGASRNLANVAQQAARQVLGGTLGLLSSTIGAFVILFGIIFISAYLLADVRRMKATFILASPHRYRRDAHQLWSSLSYSLSRYLGGLVLSMSVQGFLSAVALYFIGVPYALLLGLWVAAVAVLPYIGAWLGAVPAVLIALSISPTKALLTAILFLAIQQLEGNFLTPKIQSQALQVHPIIVFLTVIVVSSVFGILGAVFAVPSLAVLRVLFDFFGARLKTEPSTPSFEEPPGKQTGTAIRAGEE